MDSNNIYFREFKENCEIERCIITKYKSPKDFQIVIYCLEKDMNMYKERTRLFYLCKKYGIHYLASP